MALVVGNLVYLAVNGGLMSDPPLFGVVDLINGTPPNLVRVNWENGAQQTFASADEAVNRLVVFTEDVPIPAPRDHRITGAWSVIRRFTTVAGTLQLVRLDVGLYAIVND